MLPFEEKKREILVKQKASTSDKFGCYPDDRSVEELIEYGVVNIDKPAGPTSHQVSAYVKEILGIKKAGHSGTLDPMVTGCLPVALGKATRSAKALLSAGKEYICLMHLHDDVSEDKIIAVMDQFKGEIEQLPPVRSAVKRQVRTRKIYYINILEIKERDVLFMTGTQAGTYIRKLCHDIGERLGVGAHMAELRRTKAGPFNESTISTLQDVKDAYILWDKEGNDKLIRSLIQEVEKSVEHLPKVWVLDTTVNSLCHGASLKLPGISKVHAGIKPGGTVAVMTLKDELIMTGATTKSSEDIMKSNRGIAVKPLQVFMKTDVYPKIEK